MHIFSVTVNQEDEPSIIASYPECLEYIAKLTDSWGIDSDNFPDGTRELVHLGQFTLERRRRLVRKEVDHEIVTAVSVYTRKPIQFTIKHVKSDAPKGFVPQIIHPIIGVRLKDSGIEARPNMVLTTSRGRQGKVLI